MWSEINIYFNFLFTVTIIISDIILHVGGAFVTNIENKHLTRLLEACSIYIFYKKNDVKMDGNLPDFYQYDAIHTSDAKNNNFDLQ